ncbi:MAG: hypothetical protein QOG13_901 [Sphingomonadales bacterium]|jgi:hypothetical protein|nr:hypothetical protein [Sphingomonadales bacterium]
MGEEMEPAEYQTLHAMYLRRVAAIRAYEPQLQVSLLDPLKKVTGVSSVSWRIKPWEAVVAKVEAMRVSGRSAYGFADVRDLLGMQVVVTDQSIVKPILELIEGTFDVIEFRASRGLIAGLYHAAVRPKRVLEDSLVPGWFELKIVTKMAQAMLEVAHAQSYRPDARALPDERSGGIFAGILGAAVSHALASTVDGLSNLEKAIDVFEGMIDDPNIHEKRDIHPFLKEHQFLIYTTPESILSETPIGLGTQYRLDFLVREPTGDYILVELENPNRELFTQRGDPTAAVTHAVQQVEDWQEWIEQNIQTVQRVYPEMLAPTGVVIIGRSKSLSSLQRQKLARRNINMRGRLRIETYDDILSKARAYVAGIRRALGT